MTLPWRLQFTDEDMRRALRRLPALELEDLAEGAMDEPFCGVCTALKPVVRDRLPGWLAAGVVLAYHDEATAGADEVDDDDYLYAMGLSCVLTYQRCQRTYAEARRLLAVGG